MTNRVSLLTVLLLLLGIFFVAVAVFYATTDTAILAKPFGRHYKHAVAAAAAAVVCFIGANFARARRR